jgi:hypothetical protein
MIRNPKKKKKTWKKEEQPIVSASTASIPGWASVKPGRETVENNIITVTCITTIKTCNVRDILKL